MGPNQIVAGEIQIKAVIISAANSGAGYIHLHFGSRPESAAAFVNACRVYRQERMKHKQPSIRRSK